MFYAVSAIACKESRYELLNIKHKPATGGGRLYNKSRESNLKNVRCM